MSKWPTAPATTSTLPRPRNQPHLGDATYVHHGLGAVTQDGSWHTITRNLEQEPKEAHPDNELQVVLGFPIRGSGRVDEIKTK